MPYPPGWERLSDAAARVMAAAGVSKEQAQTDISQAIADGTVEIRCKLEKHTTRHSRSSKTVLDGKDFEKPTDLKFEDLDWERSRPLKPWFVRRGGSVPAGYWDLEWIELSRTHVTNVLCAAGTPDESAQPAHETGARSRSRPAFDRAQRAIKEEYPHGVPDQAAEPNANLCGRVGK
ncbi:MAG TPA: hypothetical protein VH250_09790, partial [Granulicella sp.]|nr:hypothetical protein [Granulicella sp.]